MVDLRNETVLLEDRDEPARKYESEVRRLPSDESLRAAKFICAGIILGLVVDDEFLVLHSLGLLLVDLVDPELFLEKFIIEEHDAGLVSILKSHRRSACVIID